MGKNNLNQEDDMLLVAIKQRDMEIFEAFYKNHYKQLFAIAFRYTGQAQIAEEIVHDVFITIWSKADCLNIHLSMKNYLVRSVINSCLNFLKKEKIDAKKKLFYSKVQDERFYEQEDDREEELFNRLDEALKLLPEKCRKVMYLSRYSRLKQQEIADQMNISIKTVKNHLTYGFKKLRVHIQQH